MDAMKGALNSSDGHPGGARGAHGACAAPQQPPRPPVRAAPPQAHREGARIVALSLDESSNSSAEELADPQARQPPETSAPVSALRGSAEAASNAPKAKAAAAAPDKLRHVPSVKAIREALVGCNAPTDLVHYVVGAVHSYETLLRRLANVIEARERHLRGDAEALDDSSVLASAPRAPAPADDTSSAPQPLPDHVLYSPSSEFSAVFGHSKASSEEPDVATPQPHLPGLPSPNAGGGGPSAVAAPTVRDAIATQPKDRQRESRAAPLRPPVSRRFRGATEPHAAVSSSGCATQQVQEPVVSTASRSHQTEGHWATRFGRVFVPTQWSESNPSSLPTSSGRQEEHGFAPLPEDSGGTVGLFRAWAYSRTPVRDPSQPFETRAAQQDTAPFNAEPHGYMIHARPVTPFVQMAEYQDLPLPTVQPLGLPDRRRCRWGALQGRSNTILPFSGTGRPPGTTTSPAGSGATLFGRAPSPPEYCSFLPHLFCCCNSG